MLAAIGPVDTLVWVGVALFAATSVITVLGILEEPNWIRVDKKRLNVLFTVLIVEIVTGGATVIVDQWQIEPGGTENVAATEGDEELEPASDGPSETPSDPRTGAPDARENVIDEELREQPDWMDEQDSPALRYGDKPPVILAIHPSDAFGPNCKKGVDAARGHLKDINVVALDTLGIKDMKAGRVDALEQELREHLEHSNVAAVVGPPISEITYRIADVLAQVDSPPPMFVTSAVAHEGERWVTTREKVPMFRIATGIDLRAHALAVALQYATHRNVNIVLFVEQPEAPDGGRTFGMRFLDEIVSVLEGTPGLPRGSWTVERFHPTTIESHPERYASILEDPHNFVLFLGLGHQLEHLIDEFYRIDDTGRAYLGGWMNAFSLDRQLKTGRYDASRLFEISDFGGLSIQSDSLHMFENEIGPASPALRDEALYFDSLITAGHALARLGHSSNKKDQYIVMDDHARRLLASEIAKSETHGVMGPIRFSYTGENARYKLSFFQYDVGERRWTRLFEYWQLF